MNAVVQLARQNKAEDPHVSSVRTLRFFFFFFFSASSCSFRFLLARSSSFAAFAAAFAAFASYKTTSAFQIDDFQMPRMLWARIEMSLCKCVSAHLSCCLLLLLLRQPRRGLGGFLLLALLLLLGLLQRLPRLLLTLLLW